MKKFQRILAMVLSVAMLASMASVSLAEATYDGIEVTMIHDRNPPTQDELKELFGETMEDNRYTRLFEEALDIDLTYDWYATGDTFDQKIKLAIASGALSDLFVVQDLTDLKQLAEEGAIQPLTEVYEEYASDLLKELLTPEGTDAIFESVTIDGEVYAIPRRQATYKDTPFFFIRQDWLDNLGLERPTTVEEMYEVGLAFTYDDPDGNGIDDTYGLIMDKSLWDYCSATGFFNCFGAYPDRWIFAEDGSIVEGSIQPEVKEALTMLNKFYEDGILDPEFVVKDNSQSSQLMTSGQVGMAFGADWTYLTPFIQAAENDPDAEWVCIESPTATGEPVEAIVQPGVDSYLCVYADFEHPEILIEMLNLFAEALYGEDADFYYWYFDVLNIWTYPLTYTLDPMQNLKIHAKIVEATEQGTLDSMSVLSTSFYTDCQEYFGWEMVYGAGEYTQRQLTVMVDEGRVSFEAYMQAPTETMLEKQSVLDDLKNATFTKIIMGELDVDEGFDTYVEQWLSIGGEQITAEINESLVIE